MLDERALFGVSPDGLFKVLLEERPGEGEARPIEASDTLLIGSPDGLFKVLPDVPTGGPTAGDALPEDTA